MFQQAKPNTVTFANTADFSGQNQKSVDDWIGSSMNRFARAEPFAIEPRRLMQRVTEGS